jgi:hypothetical protein
MPRKVMAAPAISRQPRKVHISSSHASSVILGADLRRFLDDFLKIPKSVGRGDETEGLPAVWRRAGSQRGQGARRLKARRR